ncbi:MAG: efflux RND transporter permease subunit [Hyphomonadaceae bacterium]
MNGLLAWWGRNPVAGNLLMVAFFVLGLFSFFQMEKEFWPAGRGDSVQINAVWPGASPEDMESQVTVRIEEATASLNGINWVRSRSGEGYAWVNLTANSSVDIDALTAEARSLVDSISGLPAGMEPLRVTRSVGRNWSIIIGVHGNVDERTLRDTAERLRDRIALVPGGANTMVVGVRSPEVSIEVSEDSLREYGLTFDDVSRSVRSNSLNASAGMVQTDDGNFQLSARNLADTALEFNNIIVRQTQDGGIVRMRDVANVVDGFQDTNLYSRMNGDPSALVVLQTADQFNIWDTNKAVQDALREFREQLPAGVQVTTIYNETEDFNALLSILFWNALQGFALVFLLLMLTLHPKVAFWVTTGVMVAFAGGFFILPYVNVSLNFLSVFAFLLVLGIMVDDAIIVGESIYEKAERGETGVDHAIIATQLVLKPVIASVLTTMIAFSPLILIEGDVRQFTRAITIVVSSTLVFSLMESLFILPAHLAHIKRTSGDGKGLFARVMRLQQACSAGMIWFAQNIQRPLAGAAVKMRYLTGAVFLGIFIVTMSLMGNGYVKQTFMPEVEGDFMQISIELPQTTPFSRMQQVADQLDAARLALEHETTDRAYQDPNTGRQSRGVVRSWSQSIDDTAIRAYVGLTPPETRDDLRSSDITKRLEELMGPVPDAERLSFSLSGGNGGPSIDIAMIGENSEDLRLAVDELKQRLDRFSEVLSVRDSQEAAIEELNISLLPGAEQLGLTLMDVTRQVRQAYYGDEAQRLPRDGDDVRVYVRYPRDDRRTLESLGGFRVRTSDGREVPLASVATWEFRPGVTGLDRRQRMSSIMVSAELTNAESRADIMRTLNDEFFPSLQSRFPTVSRRALGEAESQAEFMSQLLRLMIMSLFAMYFLLAVTFRSYWQPMLIMTVLPFALVGAILGHFALGVSFALFSYFGMVAAMGVSVNDNVVLIDRVNQIRGYFAMRQKQAGQQAAEIETQDFAASNGEVWEVARIDRSLELHEKFIERAIAANFTSGPLELRHSDQMRWEKSELRESAQDLEAIGFQVVRVKAYDGIVEASSSRFRQIVLTSLTTVFALVPMLMENAAIVQFLKPMALALAGGVLLCMPPTLFMTPALYMIGVDIKRGVGGLFGFYGRLYGGRRKLAAAE